MFNTYLYVYGCYAKWCFYITSVLYLVMFYVKTYLAFDEYLYVYGFLYNGDVISILYTLTLIILTTFDFLYS